MRPSELLLVSVTHHISKSLASMHNIILVVEKLIGWCRFTE